jgi:hypothetical protein
VTIGANDLALGDLSFEFAPRLALAVPYVEGLAQTGKMVEMQGAWMSVVSTVGATTLKLDGI